MTISHPSLHAFIHEIPLREAIRQGAKPLVTIKANETLETAVRRLAENRLHSLPILDSKTGSCLGLLDVADIVAYILQVAPEDETKIGELQLQELKMLGRSLALETVERIAGRFPELAHNQSCHCMNPI